MKYQEKVKLLRITTVSSSLRGLLRGQLKYMSVFFETHAASNPGWELDDLKVEENTEPHPISIERAPSPVKDLKSLLKLRALISSLKPNIVHTHTPKAGLLGMIAAYICRVPIRLHTVAGLPWMESTGSKRKLLMTMERLTYTFATHVYSNSHALRSFILENELIDPAKVSVIGNGSSNGVNTDMFDLTPELIEKANQMKEEWGVTSEKVIVFVGRLVKDKGIEELLTAFARLKDRYDVKLLLVGPFEKDRDPLSTWAEEMIETDNDIITTGFVNDVRPYFATADLLAFPSYREGFPNVPMQAGAMGIPSVVTNINGCNEIIKNGDNGLIIPVKNEEALQSAIERLLQDERLLRKLKSNARQMIVDRYGQAYLWSLLLEEYRNHLKKVNIDV